MSLMKKDDKQEMAGHHGLAVAVVLMACKDYETALKGHNAKQQHEVEKFFRSTWFGVLCDLDPEEIMNRIRKHARN